jgi:hypothetical protein
VTRAGSLLLVFVTALVLATSAVVHQAVMGMLGGLA